MSSRVFSLLVLAVISLHSASAKGGGAPKKILTIGDSWAEYSGNSFAKYCKGTVQASPAVKSVAVRRVLNSLRTTHFGLRLFHRSSRVSQINRGIGGTTATSSSPCAIPRR